MHPSRRSPSLTTLAAVAGAPMALMALGALATSVGALGALESGTWAPVHEHQAGTLDAATIEGFTASLQRAWVMLLGVVGIGVLGGMAGVRWAHRRMIGRAEAMRVYLQARLGGDEAPGLPGRAHGPHPAVRLLRRPRRLPEAARAGRRALLRRLHAGLHHGQDAWACCT